MQRQGDRPRPSPSTTRRRRSGRRSAEPGQRRAHAGCQGIKSRPVYRGCARSRTQAAPLRASGRRRAGAARRRLRGGRPPGLRRARRRLCTRFDRPRITTAALPRSAPMSLAGADRRAASVPRSTVSLDNATMGTRLYIAGTEGFIGQAMRWHSTRHRLPLDPTEHRGSLARRVQCVHCKGITENVDRLSPFTCSHCGLPLLVRDHYSRRLGGLPGRQHRRRGAGHRARAGGAVPVTSTPRCRSGSREITPVAEAIKRFRFERARRRPMPVFSGGAHVVVSMDDGGMLRRNPYSLMSRARRYRRLRDQRAARRESRGGSAFLHEQVKPGDELTRQPAGQSVPARPARRASIS